MLNEQSLNYVQFVLQIYFSMQSAQNLRASSKGNGDLKVMNGKESSVNTLRQYSGSWSSLEDEMNPTPRGSFVDDMSYQDIAGATPSYHYRHSDYKTHDRPRSRQTEDSDRDDVNKSKIKYTNQPTIRNSNPIIKVSNRIIAKSKMEVSNAFSHEGERRAILLDGFQREPHVSLTNINIGENHDIKSTCRIAKQQRREITNSGILDETPVKQFVVTIENLRTLPPSGKLDILIEFPCQCNTLDNGNFQTVTSVDIRPPSRSPSPSPFASVDVRPPSRSPSPSPFASVDVRPPSRSPSPFKDVLMEAQEDDDEECLSARNSPVPSRRSRPLHRPSERKPEMQYLSVNGMRERANSDSKITRSRSPTRLELPEIRVEDFSKKQTKKEKNTPEVDTAEEDDYGEKRQRSFTCPVAIFKPFVTRRQTSSQLTLTPPSTLKAERTGSERNSFVHQHLSQVSEDLF